MMHESIQSPSHDSRAESQQSASVRQPDIRSSFPRKATEVGFIVGMACAGMFGLFSLILGFFNHTIPGPDFLMIGCVMIVLGVPFFGIFGAVCFGTTARHLEILVRGNSSPFDPDEYEIRRALDEDEEDPNKSKLDEASETIYLPESEQDAVRAPDSTLAPRVTKVITPSEDVRP